LLPWHVTAQLALPVHVKRIEQDLWNNILLQNKTHSEKNLSSRYQILLQSHRHQDSVVLTWGETHRSVEVNSESQKKPVHLWSIDCWQGCKRMVPLTNDAGTTGCHREMRTPCTIKSKAIKVQNVRAITINGLDHDCLDMTPKA
jgi:hypothetical protein